MGVFKIDVKDFVWIDDSQDDPNDLCLHGTVNVTIGEERFQFGTTVSAAALYMLKSLTEDHLADDVIQMLPCCGHFIIANEDLTEVVITGCGMGIDWKVLHSGDNVKLVRVFITKLLKILCFTAFKTYSNRALPIKNR